MPRAWVGMRDRLDAAEETSWGVRDRRAPGPAVEGLGPAGKEAEGGFPLSLSSEEGQGRWPGGKQQWLVRKPLLAHGPGARSSGVAGSQGDPLRVQPRTALWNPCPVPPSMARARDPQSGVSIAETTGNPNPQSSPSSRVAWGAAARAVVCFTGTTRNLPRGHLPTRNLSSEDTTCRLGDRKTTTKA